MDCTDGLGFLKNLSYVENNGVPFVGKQSGLEIIVNCLKRTNLEQNIYTSINIFHENMLLSEDVFDKTYFNSFRFIKDDQETYMNCDEVLRSILEPFAACITQYKGGWYIYKPNELFDYSELEFFAYDSDGVALGTPEVTIEFIQNLGSQINGFYPHHVNKNQQLTIDSSIGAYKINYKYGLVKSFFDNIYLENITNVVDEWTINDATNLSFPTDNKGFILDTMPYASPTSTPTLVITSDSFNFAQDNILRFNTLYQFNSQGGITGKIIAEIYFKVILTDGVDTYYLDGSGNWINSDTLISSQLTSQLKNLIIQSNSIPIDGSVSIEIYRPVRLNTQGTAFDDAIITKCEFSPIDEELADVKGENHNFEINDKPSTKIEKVKQVYNGDNPSDVYVGTIYEGDQTTPTEFWYRNEAFVAFLHYFESWERSE